jgi:hypothetical protein
MKRDCLTLATMAVMALALTLGAASCQKLEVPAYQQSAQLTDLPAAGGTLVQGLEVAPSVTAAPTLLPTPRQTLPPTLPPTASPTSPPMAMPASQATVSNPIVLENQQAGATDWGSSPNFAQDRLFQIGGYTDPVSVNAGETITFAISTRTAGIPYTLSIYRLGWYNGDGARLMLSVSDLKGQAQGYWDRSSGGIVGCATCKYDASTRLIDTLWKPSYTLQIPNDWVSGYYLVKLLAAQGAAYISFVVRDDERPSELLVQIPVNTYQAYNNWGGNSLYGPNSTDSYGSDRAYKVSFNRPVSLSSVPLYPERLLREIQVIRFLEKRGYDVSYTTNVDIDRDPASVQAHRAFISVSHDEYWTYGMRDAVEKARDAGVSLAFLGGNDMYWQPRYEPDGDGHPRRVLVVYRAASLDPVAASDPSRATVRWISPPVDRPQNSVTGTIYVGRTSGPLYPWVVASSAPQLLLAGTGLKPGDRARGLVGPECDGVVNNGHQPANLAVVAAVDMQDIGGGQITCASTWYQAPSGAYVFSAGSNDWSFALDGYHQPVSKLAADPRVMKLMDNMLAAFGAHAAIQAMP